MVHAAHLVARHVCRGGSGGASVRSRAIPLVVQVVTLHSGAARFLPQCHACAPTQGGRAVRCQLVCHLHIARSQSEGSTILRPASARSLRPMEEIRHVEAKGEGHIQQRAPVGPPWPHLQQRPAGLERAAPSRAQQRVRSRPDFAVVVVNAGYCCELAPAVVELRQALQSVPPPRVRQICRPDYKGINRAAWEILLEIYGGGPAIARAKPDIYG